MLFLLEVDVPKQQFQIHQEWNRITVQNHYVESDVYTNPTDCRTSFKEKIGSVARQNFVQPLLLPSLVLIDIGG